MKPGRVVLLAGFVLLFGSSSLAQTPIDPVIGVGGGGGSVAITSPIFSIFSPSGTSPATSDCFLIQGETSTDAPGCFFQNEVGSSIRQLAFVVNNADFSGTVTCATSTPLGGAGPFSECTVGPGPIIDPTTMVTFFDGSIPLGGDFSFKFGSFNSNTTFAGTATTVPEPSTLAFFLGGIGALLARRRSRAR